MPAYTDLQWPSNESRLMRLAQRSVPLNTALMHPAANFLPSTPVLCNKDRAINQPEIADTRHRLMKWGTLELMTNVSLRYGHSMPWQSAKNIWPLLKSSATFLPAQQREWKWGICTVGGYERAEYFLSSAESLSTVRATTVWPGLPFSYTKALRVTFSRLASLANWGLFRAKQSTPSHCPMGQKEWEITGYWVICSEENKHKMKRKHIALKMKQQCHTEPSNIE